MVTLVLGREDAAVWPTGIGWIPAGTTHRLVERDSQNLKTFSLCFSGLSTGPLTYGVM